MNSAGPDQPAPNQPSNEPPNGLSPNGPPSNQPPNYQPTYPPRRSVDLLDKKDLSPATLLEIDNSTFLTNEINQSDYQRPARVISRPAPEPIGKLSHSNSLTSSAATTATKNIYYSCGHCSYRFMFNDLEGKLVKCPSCKKSSSLSDSYKNTNGIIFLLLFLAFFIVGTYAGFHKTAINIVFKIVTILVAFLFLARSIYFFTIKVSPINLSIA